MLSEERIKELVGELWDEIIHFKATQESVERRVRALLAEERGEK